MLVFLTLIIPLAQFSTVHSEESTVTNKALAYTLNILPVDTKQYNIALDSYNALPSGPTDTSLTESVAYVLNSTGSSLRVVYVFKNEDFYQCGLSVQEGSVINATAYVNLADVARDMLQKYQTFTGADSTEMLAALSMVDETKSLTVTSGNVVLTVSHMSIPKTMNSTSSHLEARDVDSVKVTSFSWNFIYNGAQYNNVHVDFEDGVFHTLWDDRAIAKVGNIDVKVSEEAAIDAALMCLENLSYTSDGVEISGFNVSRNDISATLKTTMKDDNLLYPFWNVALSLDKTYPSGIYSILVKIWAGTGEVFEISTQGFSGSVPVTVPSPWPTATLQPENSATPSVPSPSQSQELPFSNVLIIGLAVGAAVAVTAAVTFMVVKRRRIALSSLNGNVKEHPASFSLTRAKVMDSTKMMMLVASVFGALLGVFYVAMVNPLNNYLVIMGLFAVIGVGVSNVVLVALYRIYEWLKA